MKRFLLPLFFCLLAATLPVAAELPTAESIFQKSIDKSGGSEALAKIKSTVLTGTLTMPAQNVSGSLKIFSEGEKTYSAITLPGLGTVEDGFDGDIAWEVSAIQGARIKEGDEKAALKNSSSINMFKNWKERFKDLKTVGTEEIEGKPAYKVEVTPNEGKPLTMFFDQTSGLLVRLSVVVPTPMGEVPTDTFLSDYKPVSGVMTPFTMTQKIMTASIVTKFDAVEYNADIPKDRFDLPQKIKELVEKRKAK